MSQRRHEIAVGALLLVALGILAYLAVAVGALRIEAGSYDVEAVFEHAGGVTTGAVVSLAGVDVGTVDRLWVQDGQAHMALSIGEDTQVSRDTRAAIRARSVLGEKYVQLLPGVASAPLKEGDVISNTEVQVEIDEMVNAMGPLLQAVHPEQVDALLSTLSAALNKDPERLERMLGDTEALLHNLRVASEDAPALVGEGRQAVAELRATNARMQPLIARGEAVLTSLERASGPLADASAQAPALIAETQAAVADGRALIQKLDGSTGRLEHVLENLEGVDMTALRKLAREDGVLVRLRPAEPEE
ncbi:MAG: MlaD family protein [Pseudomonadota bacterium]